MNGRRSRINRRALALALTAKPAALGFVAVGTRAANAAVACDGGALAAAITAANLAGTPTTISLAPGCAYVLTAPVAVNSADGLPPISKTVVIEGNNATITRSGTSKFRLLHVSSSGDLTIRHLTLTNGVVDASTNGTDEGGGILNEGALNIQASTISHNLADGSGSSGMARGGGIRSTGPLTIVDSTISDNAARVDQSLSPRNGAFATGGGISAKGGRVTIRNTTLAGNRATAIANGVSNSMTAEGGALTAESAQPDQPTAKVDISGSTFSGNEARATNLSTGTLTAKGTGAGGAIALLGTEEYVGSVNSVPTPYISAIQASVRNSTLVGNSAVLAPIPSSGPNTIGGGAIAMIDSSRFQNSIPPSQNSLAVVNSTIADNTSSGGAVDMATGTGVAVLTNTILSNNNTLNCRGTVANGGHNISFPADPGTSCDAPFLHASPRLDVLRDNGGPTIPATQTMALLPGSAAIDGGLLTACTAAAPAGVAGIDQRAQPRVEVSGDSTCDIGAYEVQPVAVVPSPSPSPAQSATPAATVRPTLPKAGDHDPDGGLPWPLALPIAALAAGGLVSASRRRKNLE